MQSLLPTAAATTALSFRPTHHHRLLLLLLFQLRVLIPPTARIPLTPLIRHKIPTPLRIHTPLIKVRTLLIKVHIPLNPLIQHDRSPMAPPTPTETRIPLPEASIRRAIQPTVASTSRAATTTPHPLKKTLAIPHNTRGATRTSPLETPSLQAPGPTRGRVNPRISPATNFGAIDLAATSVLFAISPFIGKK